MHTFFVSGVDRRGNRESLSVDGAGDMEQTVELREKGHTRSTSRTAVLRRRKVATKDLGTADGEHTNLAVECLLTTTAGLTTRKLIGTPVVVKRVGLAESDMINSRLS